jgi:23S rRNA (uracil1939-C5)-methyltransferase
VVFVPGTAPQDRIRAQVRGKKSRFWEAELLEVLQPSPYRRKPPCPVAERCGGCSWQHISYPAQMEQKQQILESSLRSLRKWGELPMRPLRAAPDEFHYRSRIQIQIQGEQFGFFAKRSKELVAIQECWISEPPINQKLKQLSANELRGHDRLELALNSEGGVDLRPQSQFSQVNRAQNAILKVQVAELVAGSPVWIMDLYAGSGNLTVPLHQRFPNVPMLAVEFTPLSVQLGQALALPGVEWRQGDVAKVLERSSPREGAGLIVLDPPRTGCTSEVMTQLMRHKPKQIIYVSCNPMTFARDVQIVLQQGEYRLQSVQGLDMFPQTEHVEVIASLERVQ